MRSELGSRKVAEWIVDDSMEKRLLAVMEVLDRGTWHVGPDGQIVIRTGLRFEGASVVEWEEEEEDWDTPPVWIWCEACEEEWLESEYDSCPGCVATSIGR